MLFIARNMSAFTYLSLPTKDSLTMPWCCVLSENESVLFIYVFVHFISINVKCEVLTGAHLSGFCGIFLCLSFILGSFSPSYPKKACALYVGKNSHFIYKSTRSVKDQSVNCYLSLESQEIRRICKQYAQSLILNVDATCGKHCDLYI
jgi:hypothetical protein